MQVTTDFPFLGERPYLHGTSIVSGFLDLLDLAAPGPAVIGRIKLQKTSFGNGSLRIAAEPLAREDAERANVLFTARSEDRTWHGAFTDESIPVRRREAASYPISGLSAHEFGGRCRIAPTDRDDLVRALIEANKRFHEATFAQRHAGARPGAVRFGYLESWPCPRGSCRFESELVATNLIARELPEGTLTINRLAYADPVAGNVSLTLCFKVLTEGNAP